MASYKNILSATWWLVCPSFVLVTFRFSVDLACRDPYNLAPDLASSPMLAWTVATVYVAAHVWLLCALMQAVVSGESSKWFGAVRAFWGKTLWKVGLLLAVVAFEYTPLQVFRFAGRATGCLGH